MAAELEKYSPPAAQAFGTCADEMEAAVEGWLDEPLKLRIAAAECGFSEGYLGQLVRSGQVANVGRLNAPKIRRRDLPRKRAAVGPLSPVPPSWPERLDPAIPPDEPPSRRRKKVERPGATQAPRPDARR